MGDLKMDCPDCGETIVNGMFCNTCGWDGF